MALVQGIARRSKILRNVFQTATRKYSDLGPKGLGKKILPAGISKEHEYQLPVEQDVQRLKNYVCGTKLYEESGEEVQIKPDSEYPQWLWTLHIGKPKELKELDPTSLEYWKRVRKLGIKLKYRLFSFRRDKRDYK